MIKATLALTVFMLLFSSVAGAQSDTPIPRPVPRPGNNNESEQDLNLPPDMRARLAIERAEHLYREALKDVKQLNDLSAEIAKAYRERGRLSDEEFKKVREIEKLAKSVLNHVGGSKVDDEPDKSSRMTLGEAIDKMSVAAASISDSMTAETRYVVSAKVIGLSNEVIYLTKFIRRVKK